MSKKHEIVIDDPVILGLMIAEQERKALETDKDSLLCLKTWLKYRIRYNTLEIYAMTLADDPMAEADKFDHWFEISSFHPINSERKIFKDYMKYKNQTFDREGIKLGKEFPVEVKTTGEMTPELLKTVIEEIRTKPFQWLSAREKEDNDNKYFLLSRFNFSFEKPTKVDLVMKLEEII